MCAVIGSLQVQGLLMERVAEAQRDSERCVMERAEIASENTGLHAALRDVAKKLEYLEMELATRPSACACGSGATACVASAAATECASASRSHTPPTASQAAPSSPTPSGQLRGDKLSVGGARCVTGHVVIVAGEGSWWWHRWVAGSGFVPPVHRFD